MKTSMIVCMICLVLFSIPSYPEVLTSFPDMVRPIELRMDGGYIYISDQYSVFVYDMETFKLIKKLCGKGEGPEEFKTYPRIAFTRDRIILYDPYKIIIYTKDFKLIKEIKLKTYTIRTIIVGDNFVFNNSIVIDGNEYESFTLYNSKIEKIKDLLIDSEDPKAFEFLISHRTSCRSWNEKVFIAQTKKGFYIDVFNEKGDKLYEIEKKVKKIKSGEKHRKLIMEEVLYFVGRRRDERARQRGAFKRPMREEIEGARYFILYVLLH